ncbi:MAG: hypothetical protein MI924_01600 [Chloroflexales bacterium]|nr:hypothetical protein [Chloroflexales bacterium]
MTMALGVLFGYLFDPTALRSIIIPLTFLMVYPMMVTLNIKEIFSGGDTKLQLTTQLMNFVLIPFIGWAIGQLFFCGATADCAGFAAYVAAPDIRHENLLDRFCQGQYFGSY